MDFKTNFGNPEGLLDFIKDHAPNVYDALMKLSEADRLISISIVLVLIPHLDKKLKESIH